ncbi:threonine dehydratase [Kineococcus xinjiangensis]|uniref:Threonine dehydratase n=1 Tax=Kineococcus xinjiangensis TaxID=512762 RepID=A0A2S6IER6_9ACTN|nr:threonine/serine dehydratase [Kineococcus xinjiangensis]PPK92650.1 threonine dehydratase [Kineococcus xinjiangensis]
MTITRADVEAAAARTAGWVRSTPVLRAEDLPRPAWLKLEFLQHTGTFKARGAFNRILAAREQGDLDARVGIVVASGGNAGLANAHAAARLGVPATVFVPTTAPQVKVDGLRRLGAEVVQLGAEYAVAYAGAVEHAAATGAVYCHAYDQPEIAAGAGVVGAELLDQLAGEVDTVVVAVGGGGLMAGIAAAVEGAAQVVAVEPATIPTLHAALAAGEPVDVGVSGVAADSLGARRIGDIAFDVAVRARVRSVLVADDGIVAARRRLWEQHRIVVEHGAAAALAALLDGAHVPAPGERVAVVLCGANTDPADLSARKPPPG